MNIIYDSMCPRREHYDKRWKRIARKLGFKVKADRITYDAYKLPNGDVVMHPKYKKALTELK